MLKSKVINKNVLTCLLIGWWLAANQSETMFQNACRIKRSSLWQYLSDPGSCYASPLKKRHWDLVMYILLLLSFRGHQIMWICESLTRRWSGVWSPSKSNPVKFEFHPLSGLSANAQNLKSGIDGWTNSQGLAFPMASDNPHPPPPPHPTPTPPPTPSYSVDGGT